MNVIRWTVGLALLIFCAGPAMAQETIQAAFNYDLEACSCSEPACDCAEPDCCCDDSCCEECGDECCDSCGDECCDLCGDECCDSCGDGCCDSCGCNSSCGLFGCGCCLGEPYAIQDCLVDDCCWLSVGGWTQFGYHSDQTRQSVDFADLFAFNDVPDGIRLHQQWLYFEKVAEASACSADWGFRVDVMYGTDAQKTQAFGNDGGTWDVTFDNGYYGWAIPQAYAELAYGDWSWKIGHFYTLIGYEVVPAPDNFFYSHSLTMFNSEPFTHTGVLGTYTASDTLSVHAGWTLGWDTGFDQNQGGSSFLGGFTKTLMDDITYTYCVCAGNFGARTSGTDGYSHSNIIDFTLTDKLNYVVQSDLVSYDDPGNAGFDTQVGVNQYLFYSINDCWKAGGRLEWWKSNGGLADANDSVSYYEVTGGVNYKPHANVIVRPEIRYDWTPAENATFVGYNQTVFGVDVILTY